MSEAFHSINHDRRGRRALLYAVAIHVVLLAGLAAVTRALPPAVPPPAPPVAEGEHAIELVEAPSAPTPSPSPPLPAAVAATGHGGSSAASARTAIHAAERDVREPPPNAAPVEPRAPAEAPPVVGVTMGGAFTTPPNIGLQLGAPKVFASNDAPPEQGAGEARGERAPVTGLPGATAAEMKRKVENSLREPARQRERELGLGPEGPVMHALCDATTASTAPVTGRAVFRAVADATGIVVGLDVLSCDGGPAGWAHAAELAKEGLSGKKLRLPSTASSAEMKVEITSAWKLPSGHDTGTDVTLGGIRTQKGDGKQSSSVAVLDVVKYREVQVTKDFKVPVITPDPDLISVHGDSVNAGAKPRRIVQAKLLDSKVL